MDKMTKNRRCAVRLPENKADLPLIEEYLEGQGMADARTYLPKDDDDLDRDILAGHIDHVVYPSLDALLTAIWKGDAQIDAWSKRDIRIEIADAPAGESCDTLAYVKRMYESLKQWRRGHERRQVVASAVLSILGLAALAILFGFLPPTR